MGLIRPINSPRAEAMKKGGRRGIEEVWAGTKLCWVGERRGERSCISDGAVTFSSSA